MSRYVGPRLKIARALGAEMPGLTAKSREKRPYPPGQHGQGRKKLSEYAIRVMETKKLRFNYGLSESQFRRLVVEARHMPTATVALLELLERRLDNVVFRAGFARTIPAARQIVTHGHVLVNGQRCDIASYRVKPNDEIKIKAPKGPLADARFDAPTWLAVDRGVQSAKMTALPDPTSVLLAVDVKLIIEHYASRL